MLKFIPLFGTGVFSFLYYFLEKKEEESYEEYLKHRDTPEYEPNEFIQN